MYFLNLESLWSDESMPTIWYGLRFSTTTTSDASDFYWTPYWDKRLLGVLRYETDSDRLSFRADLMGGFSKSDGRGGFVLDDENYTSSSGSTFRNEKDRDTDWEAIWGFSGLYSYDITDWMKVAVEYDILAMRSYIDHMVLLYILAHF